MEFEGFVRIPTTRIMPGSRTKQSKPAEASKAKERKEDRYLPIKQWVLPR
jgi:hypothetical protein